MVRWFGLFLTAYTALLICNGSQTGMLFSNASMGLPACSIGRKGSRLGAKTQTIYRFTFSSQNVMVLAANRWIRRDELV